MDQSLEVLRHARMMQSSADLWQLEIILSDGICENHDYIKNRVHMAAEEHIAMVFIILDTRSEKDSILNMSNVSYDIDPNTNMPILKMNRYMDTFPFDYYVLVRNVETLPEVLSDILRQFFMFIAS
jgi:midasin